MRGDATSCPDNRSTLETNKRSGAEVAPEHEHLIAVIGRLFELHLISGTAFNDLQHIARRQPNSTSAIVGYIRKIDRITRCESNNRVAWYRSSVQTKDTARALERDGA